MPLQRRQVVLGVVRVHAALARHLAQVQPGELLDAAVDPAARLQRQQVVARGEGEVEREQDGRVEAG
jgi:hypothetical protein